MYVYIYIYRYDTICRHALSILTCHKIVARLCLAKVLRAERAVVKMQEQVAIESERVTRTCL